MKIKPIYRHVFIFAISSVVAAKLDMMPAASVLFLVAVVLHIIGIVIDHWKSA